MADHILEMQDITKTFPGVKALQNVNLTVERGEVPAEIRARAKADADAERQIALVNAKEKLGEEFDRKEKALSVELKMCADRRLPRAPRLSRPLSTAPPHPTTPCAAMRPWPRRASAAACSRRATSSSTSWPRRRRSG